MNARCPFRSSTSLPRSYLSAKPTMAGGRTQTSAAGRTGLLIKKAKQFDPTALPQDLQDKFTFVVSPQAPAMAGQPQGPSDMPTTTAPGTPHTISVELYSSSSLPDALHDWAFLLVRDTLQAMYEPVWGWKDEDKRKQLRAPTSRFLVAWATPTSTAVPAPQAQTTTLPDPQAAAAPQTLQGPAVSGAQSAAGQSGGGDDRQQQRDTTAVGSAGTAVALLGGGTAAAAAQGNPNPVVGGREAVAYVNYRFEEGYNKDAVLYTYEVMVSPAWQRLGMASRLMELAEAMAWDACMDRVVLTVLLANKAAHALYRKHLQYNIDKASPPAIKGYEILSKERPSAQQAAKAAKKKG